MPAKSIGIRMSNWMMDETGTSRVNYHYIPDIMWGASKHLMVHAEGFFSNRKTAFVAEGAGIYAKYRFYSADKMHHHVRMAAFARASTNNATVHQEMLVTNGHNSG